MKNNKTSLSSLLILSFIVFCLLGKKTQNKIIIKTKDLLSLNDTTRSTVSDSNGGGNTSYIFKKTRTQETKDYFEEIALNTEWNGKRDFAFKWKKNIKIYVYGEKTSTLLSELNDIVSELNDIITTIDIEVVSNHSDANLFIYLGSYEDFWNYYPELNKDLLVHNFGYFQVSNLSAIMYVDTYRANETEQRHLLREELTQSLGLFNDSYKYPESIFYQGWTTTTEYAPIDIELIEMLYNE